MGPRKYETHNGYHLVTPLERSSSPPNQATTILVNRGFISDSTAASFNKDAERISKHASTDTTAVVDGMLAPPFTPSTFTPANDPEKNVWIWADVPAIAQHAGGEAENVQPILVESVFEGGPGEASARIAAGKPVGRYPAVFFRNQHASYAITWYSLSLGTALLFFRLVTKKRTYSFGR